MKRLPSYFLLLCLVLAAGCSHSSPAQPDTSPATIEQPTYDEVQASATGDGLIVDMAEMQLPSPPLDQDAAPIYTKLTKLLAAKPLSKQDKIADELSNRVLPSTERLEKARLALHRRDDIVKLVHAAAARPRCVFVRPWTKGNPMAVLLPELAIMRKAVHFLRAETLVLLHDGKPLDAVRVMSLGFRIARHSAEERTAIAYLVGVAVDAITFSGMEQILLLAGSDPAVASAVHAAITKEWTARSLAEHLAGETALQIWTTEIMRKKGAAVEYYLDDTKAAREKQASAPNVPEEESSYWDSIADSNGILILQRMRRLHIAADKLFPEAEGAFRTVAAEVDKSKDPTLVLSKAMFPNVIELPASRARIQAISDIDRASSSLLTWKAKNGNFPETLQAALPVVPTDPFDGKPLRYRREGEGFVIYSIGKDGKYDGGAPTKKPKGVDVVFRYPLPSYYRVGADGKK